MLFSQQQQKHKEKAENNNVKGHLSSIIIRWCAGDVWWLFGFDCALIDVLLVRELGVALSHGSSGVGVEGEGHEVYGRGGDAVEAEAL